jgi:NADPH-dependent curcumin reductase CurA
VQLAKALGLYVVGVAGPSNVEWVKQQLGADEVLDYSKQVGAACGVGLECLCTSTGHL